MKVAVHWSYIEAGTLILNVKAAKNSTPEQVLDKLINSLVLKADDILDGNEDIDIDEITTISPAEAQEYHRHPKGKLIATDPLGLGVILGVDMLY